MTTQLSDNQIDISLKIDLNAILNTIEEAKDLKDNNEVFKRLSTVAEAKREVVEALGAVERIEYDIKRAISDRARQLYGDDWQAIVGSGYKITRYYSGNVYVLDGEPDKAFVKVTRTIDSDAVAGYVKAQNKLPEGVAVNPNRNEVIRLTVEPNDSSQA